MFDIKKFTKGVEVEAQKRIRKAAVKAVEKFGERVIGKSQQLAPIDTGFLSGSSAVTLDAKESGKTIKQVIGHNASYAAAVHERIDVHHEGGEAKFLEKAINRQGPKFEQFVSDEIKKAL